MAAKCVMPGLSDPATGGLHSAATTPPTSHAGACRYSWINSNDHGR